jgi:hypothetical protein
MLIYFQRLGLEVTNVESLQTSTNHHNIYRTWFVLEGQLPSWLQVHGIFKALSFLPYMMRFSRTMCGHFFLHQITCHSQVPCRNGDMYPNLGKICFIALKVRDVYPNLGRGWLIHMCYHWPIRCPILM